MFHQQNLKKRKREYFKPHYFSFWMKLELSFAQEIWMKPRITEIITTPTVVLSSLRVEFHVEWWCIILFSHYSFLFVFYLSYGQIAVLYFRLDWLVYYWQLFFTGVLESNLYSAVWIFCTNTMYRFAARPSYFNYARQKLVVIVFLYFCWL